MNATEARRIIRAQFPDYVVGMKLDTFNYLHHDDSAFERRSIPCIHVTITSKDFHLDSLDRRVYHHPDITEVTRKLRAAGLCAECTTVSNGGVTVMLTEREAWPVNKALCGLGMWHYAAH